MSRQLLQKTYTPGPFTCFPITDPKLREVWAADFKDRILHHLLVSAIEPHWEKIFIHDSYACRTAKGAHKAIAKIKRILTNHRGSTSSNNRGSTSGLYYLHLDIRGFFTSIDKEILFSIITKKMRHPELLYLTELVIFHNPKSNYIIKGNVRILRDIPRHKSLFGVPDGKGLPIGNYTSQFFANVYLNELDQYAKRVLKCRYYFRYMDDVIILHQSRNYLRGLIKSIDIFLQEKLKIELHPKKIILQRADKGIDALGYILHPDYALSRRRVVGNIRSKLAKFNKLLVTVSTEVEPRGSTSKSEIENVVRKAQEVINSYWGHFKHADCAKLKAKLYEKHFGELKRYLEKSDDGDHFVIKKQPEMSDISYKINDSSRGSPRFNLGEP